MSRRMLEKDVERLLVQAIKRRGGLCLKWTCPGWVGVPDRIILLPGARVMFVELKRPEGARKGPLQDWWRDTIMRLGFDHRYIYTPDGVDRLEKDILLDQIMRR